MRGIPDPRDAAKIREALASRNPGALQRFEVFVGGRLIPWPVEPRLTTQDNRMGAVVDFYAPGSYPWIKKRQKVRVNLITNGVSVPQYTGEVRTLKRPRAGIRISAVTGGFWNDRVVLGSARAYGGWEPRRVIWNAVMENQAYDHAHTEISPSKSPVYHGEEGYREIDTVHSVLESVIADATLLAFDNSLGGLTVKPYVGPAEALDVIRTLVVGGAAGIEEEEWEPEETEDDYSEVRVYKELQLSTGGTEIVYLIDPIPIPDAAAPPQVPYLVPISEISQDSGNALSIGQRVARRLVHQEHTQTITLPYIDPVAEEGDAYEILQADTEAVAGAVVIRHWIGVIQTQRPTWANRQHEMDLRLVIAREENVEQPKVLPMASARSYRPPDFVG